MGLEIRTWIDLTLNTMKIFTISGLGADKRVFQYLTLEHELIHVDWIAPKEKEPIADYAKRLVGKYQIDNELDYGIMGVSFGGLIATEISKLTKPKFTILISSIETKSELPWFMRLAGKLRLVNFVPKAMLLPPNSIASFMFGTSKKELLGAILKDSDLRFTKWAIGELLRWKNHSKLKNLIKICGMNDKLLPPKGKNSILIENGEHFMIVDRAKEISSILNEKLRFYSD